ncbi:Glutamate receptor [Abeliophyllum distichum]|uniref:Glutamate receptor n=1 Tax=Abeliophyllum distichum TaxID=126358 RepID=A0ABD1TZ30_9LAMI
MNWRTKVYKTRRQGPKEQSTKEEKTYYKEMTIMLKPQYLLLKEMEYAVQPPQQICLQPHNITMNLVTMELSKFMATVVPSTLETNSTVPATTNSSSTAQVPVPTSNFAPFGMNLTQAASVKLDKNNFLLWKNVIMPIVRGHGLEGYLMGTNECPHQIISTQITIEAGVMVRSSPNPEYSRWMSVDQLLMGWLYSSMSSEIVMRVMGCNSSSELWRAINENYGILNRSRVTFLTSELQRMRKGSMSMDQYLSSIKQLADNLEIAGNKIEHTDLVTQVLAGLDEEYTPIVVQNASSYGGKGNRSGRGSNFRGRTRGRGRFGRSNEARNPCQICGLNNHTTAWCYNRFDEKYMGKRPTDQSSNPYPSAYTATPNSVEDKAWYANSGASHHITTDKDNIAEAK